jgi:N-acyl-D-aspartate/D-glutamate deacylase
MNEELQERLMQDPLIGFCSDGSPTGFHPRGHGTYARIIEEFVGNRKTLTLEEAIRKMTSYPAEILGISDRGLIAEGMKADLVIFDPARIHETATYSNPHQLAEGFEYVIVNGEVSRGEGQVRRSGIYLMK